MTISGETYGFPRHFFPLRWNDHKILLLKNNGQVTVDERLQIHISLVCTRCNSESVVRWRFSEEYAEFGWAAALSKLLVLNPYTETCNSQNFDKQIP